MIDFGKWKKSHFKPTNLLLDPLNPRIPGAGEGLSQRDIIKDLVENDNVIELANSIVGIGYFLGEALIIVREKQKRYVLEGNRRLAAVKLLLSPEAAPDQYWQRRFRVLASNFDPNKVQKLEVRIAPSREAAAPLIMTKHTLNLFERWSPLMQAKSYRNLVDGGFTVEEIASLYNIQPSEITDSLQRYSMYSIACSLNLPEEIAKKVHSPRNFTITTLERLYKNPKANDFLGISFDELKNLIGHVDVKEFIKGYSRIISDIATGKVHSRVLNTSAEIEKYLASIDNYKPDLGKKGKFTTDTFLESSKEGDVNETIISTGRKKPIRKYIRRAMIPKYFNCSVNNRRIIDVFDELKKLWVTQYPNSVGIMFRSLLEMSLGYYLHRTNHLKKIIEIESERRKKNNQSLPRNWQPSLSRMLKYIINEDVDIITDGNLLKVIQKFVSHKHDIISIDTLHLFAHNQHFSPNEQMLRDIWSQLEGLLEIILVEPEKKPKN